MSVRRKVCVGAGGALIVLALFLPVATRPSSPDGRYVASQNIGATGDWYYEFRGGKVYFVCHEDSTYAFREPLGAYFHTEEGWFWTGIHSDDVPVRLQPSWVAMRLITRDGSHECWRRRFVPGRRPGWMLKWLPWSVQ
jgi:hypothetical protein